MGLFDGTPYGMNPYGNNPTYLKEIHETITNMYPEYTATVKLMHDMVNQ